MMSIFITEELEKYIARIPNAKLAFFFCSAQDDKHNTGVAVLRGLVHQILDKRPQLIKHALPHFETPERTQQTLASLETLWIIFSKLIADAELGRMFCVLDGLDECEESTLRVLLPRLVGLLVGRGLSSTQGSFKLAIVSRDIPGLQGCTSLRLDPDNDEKVASDIELFVSARVQELSRIEGFNGDHKTFVQTALLKRAKGTFLWVGFAMLELSQKQTCSEIWEALADLPSGLPAIYSRMLVRIPAKRRAVSQAILRWVTMAVRPLQLQELAAATDIRPFSAQVTKEQAIRDAIALSGPLLKVQEQEVSLVHQSARDYLLREERDESTVLEAFRIKLESAHYELAQVCLDCVAQSSLQRERLDLNNQSRSQESPLLPYAALHWPEHATSCSELAAELFDSSQAFFQQDSLLQRNWWESYSAAKRLYLHPKLPFLHRLCYLGIAPWVEAQVSMNSWINLIWKQTNRRDENGKTALHWASSGGNKAVVRVLVDRGADVNAKDEFGSTVLHQAYKGGNEAIVRLLVERGADVNAKDKYGNTVLHQAYKRGNEAIVRLLVERGADVNAKDEYGNTVLHQAYKRGNTAIVRLLVERGADVNVKDKFGTTVLHEAANEGDEAIVRLLVKKGADVKAKGSGGWTVLHNAAKEGNEAIVQLLVERGADVKAKSSDGFTVLHQAAHRGNEAVVRLLVDSEADINAKDERGMTALHYAALSWRENKAVVQLLIERGADVNAKDKYGNIVLHQAYKRGNEAIVRVLVERGADVKAKNSYGVTLLYWAALGGSEAVVQLLVDSEADINARDECGTTALHYAASSWRDNEAVVQLLIERGADVNAKDEYGNTVLHQAYKRGNEAIVRLLVERGADVKAKDSDRLTVLHQAAQRGNEAVVRLLVDSEADVNAKDKYGMTALHYAASSWKENEAVVQLLVERGADVNAKDEYGNTVLHQAYKRGNTAIVRLLVERGADVKAKSSDRLTVLHQAAQRGNEAIVRLLVERGANGKANDK
jgi:ankyrin repeat protein